MTLSQFLYIMRARWNVAAADPLATVVLAMGVSLMLPKQYTATATLIVDQSRPDPVTGTPYAANPSPAFMATQVDVLKSDRVAQNVVRKLGLANDPDVRELWTKENQGVGNFDAWLVDHIRVLAGREAVA